MTKALDRNTKVRETITMDDLVKQTGLGVREVKRCLNQVRATSITTMIQGQEIQLYYKDTALAAIDKHRMPVSAPVAAPAPMAAPHNAVAVDSRALNRLTDSLAQMDMDINKVGDGLANLMSHKALAIDWGEQAINTLTSLKSGMTAPLAALEGSIESHRRDVSAAIDSILTIEAAVDSMREQMVKVQEQNVLIFKHVDTWGQRIWDHLTGIKPREVQPEPEPEPAAPAAPTLRVVKADAAPARPKVAVFGLKNQLRHQIQREYGELIELVYLECEECVAYAKKGMGSFHTVIVMRYSMTDAFATLKRAVGDRFVLVRESQSHLRTVLAEIWANTKDGRQLNVK